MISRHNRVMLVQNPNVLEEARLPAIYAVSFSEQVQSLGLLSDSLSSLDDYISNNCKECLLPATFILKALFFFREVR